MASEQSRQPPPELPSTRHACMHTVHHKGAHSGPATRCRGQAATSQKALPAQCSHALDPAQQTSNPRKRHPKNTPDSRTEELLLMQITLGSVAPS